MRQFLSIVLRNQFNLFYRFGYTFIPKPQLIEFDGIINDETKGNIIKQFSTVTPFEYDEEYLILHLEKAISRENEFAQFEIQDIIAVYPLSQQAKTSIESKIDQRIRLEKPVFETLLPAIEAEIENKEVEKAISALWTICKIENPLEKYLSNIGTDSIFKGLEQRKNGTKANKIQGGNYWEYLIAYDRFDYFPNSTLGYFYDAGQVFAFSKGLPTFEGSGIHNFLEKINSANPTIKLPDILKFLETEEQLKGYVSKTTTDVIKQYIVAPLYLMLRDEIRKSDDIAQTKLFKNLGYLKKFEDSFNYAVILLGAFFGFRKFYDNYYETLNLRFYKSNKVYQKERVVEESQEQVATEFKNNLAKIGATDEKIEGHNLIDKREEENQTGNTKFEKQPNKSLKKDKIGNESDKISSEYNFIIEQALKQQSEMKLTDIAVLIKDKTKQKVTNATIKKVIEQMDGVEIVPKKKPEAARRKGKEGTLFNE